MLPVLKKEMGNNGRRKPEGLRDFIRDFIRQGLPERWFRDISQEEINDLLKDFPSFSRERAGKTGTFQEKHSIGRRYRGFGVRPYEGAIFT